MQLIIKYERQIEFRRVKVTLKKLDWYTRQGYKIILPKGITDISSDKTIKDQIEKEYNKEAFDLYSKKLLQDFNKIKNKFQKSLEKLFGDKIPKKFEMQITRYGVGGSYHLPNKIIKNFTHPKKGIKTMVHEIIHLILQKQIEKYGIEHWEKERIVDLILNSEEFKFLEYNCWQKDYHGAENYVDTLFNKFFFKDKKKFFSELSRNH
jgi:hypothetical protein